MAIPRFIPGRGGERPHYAMPNGSWVAAPQAGFFQPPPRPPQQAGFQQVRPNPNQGFQQVRPPNAASQFTQVSPPRAPTRSVGQGPPNLRAHLIRAMIEAATASPDPIAPAQRIGAGAQAPPVNSPLDIDAYIQWLMQQQPRGPRSVPQGY